MALFVRSFGPDHAPTVVLLHGGGASGWTWEPVARCLADFHCLVPDLPEHGQSATDEPFSLAGAASEVADLVRQQAHGAKAHVMGVSLGAQTALQLLATQPGLVSRTVVSGALVRPIPGLWILPILLRLYMPIRSFPPLVWLNQWSYGVPRHYRAEFRADTRRMNAETLGRVLRENYRFRVPPSLRGAEAPTLVLVGEREPRVVRASARDLADILPRGEARLALGMRHNWPLEAPERFAQAVRAWLQGSPLPKWLTPLG